MLIVNADDFGSTAVATDNIATCIRAGSVTSTSAMVFMQDSERAVDVAAAGRIDVGLHLNFDDALTAAPADGTLARHHDAVRRFLRRNRYVQVIYHPLLRRQFEYVYRTQYDEFLRLYGRQPTHVNGHHHMHLCSNVLFGNLIPRGTRIRRSFSFASGERNLANRVFRRIVDRKVTKDYITTDLFFAALPKEPLDVLRRNVALARKWNVELMVHISKDFELKFLTDPAVIAIMREAQMGTYGDLPAQCAFPDGRLPI